ncbi:MAG: hypothetical protein C5B50_12265 [Verrucomicrobia bacterium]|nr:MAG: hypothetical protein C5B50_12265 [Verrucomicrobiota bacterium]
MANRLEDRIRDYLADHLQILESGLVLIEKEYKLLNAVGAGGSIDILARDRFGHVVVIEIKRSDQAARQALNELHKYIALFRTRAGLDESRIRLIIASTEWHELLIPLSEFADATPYAVEGTAISALSDGTVTESSRVVLPRIPKGLAISRAQCIYLYQTAGREMARRAFQSILYGICGDVGTRTQHSRAAYIWEREREIFMSPTIWRHCLVQLLTTTALHRTCPFNPAINPRSLC